MKNCNFLIILVILLFKTITCYSEDTANYRNDKKYNLENLERQSGDKPETDGEKTKLNRNFLRASKASYSNSNPSVQSTSSPTVEPNNNHPENRTYIVFYNGYAYSTLDNVDPNKNTTVCSTNPMKLPSNWELVPFHDYYSSYLAASYFWQGDVRFIHYILSF
jgi:hypothetical protein